MQYRTTAATSRSRFAVHRMAIQRPSQRRDEKFISPSALKPVFDALIRPLKNIVSAETGPMFVSIGVQSLRTQEAAINGHVPRPRRQA